MTDPQCIFCKIAAGELPAFVVFKNSDAIAFLDTQPLFPGHVLLCPREHYGTLVDLPQSLAGPMMETTQLLAKAVQAAADAEGTFIAVNNYVSQTVPHLHIHVVPRRKRDGLRGFFWPRRKYVDDQAREAVRSSIEREIAKLIG